MVDISSLIIQKFLSYGLFNILIFLLVLTLLYAFLRTKKILGDNPVINAVIAFSIAFLVFAYPIISGVNLVLPLSSFFTQLFIISLVLFLGILIAGIFYPNLLEFLGKAFQSRNVLFGMIALALSLFVTSGLISVIFMPTSGATQQARDAADMSLFVAGLIILFVILLIASHISRGG